MAVKHSRTLKFSEMGSYGNLTISDLDEFTSGLAASAEVKVSVSVTPSDRGGLDQKNVTLTVEE